MNTKTQIAQLSQAISEFEAALVALRSPQPAKPIAAPTDNLKSKLSVDTPLDFLKSKLEAQEDPVIREKLVRDAEDSLSRSRKDLAKLQQEQAVLEQAANESFRHLATAMKERNALIWQLIQNIEQAPPLTKQANQTARSASRPLAYQSTVTAFQETQVAVAFISEGLVVERIVPLFEAKKLLRPIFEAEAAAA